MTKNLHAGYLTILANYDNVNFQNSCFYKILS